MNRVRVSSETHSKLMAGETVSTHSFLPCDKRDCDCFGIVKEWSEKLANSKSGELVKNHLPVDCPNSKNKKKFRIVCAECGDVIGEVNASDELLTDWCNFHYINEAVLRDEYVLTLQVDKKGKTKTVKKVIKIGEWHGCMAPQISLLDDKLGFECACGNDTRDFRVRSNLTGRALADKLKENMIGRDFNQPNSKYKLMEINNGG